jgi:dTDP-4-dehydrorhamnose reductase
MMNILVTGSKGQLGSEIQELSSEYAYNFFFTDRQELDITDVNAIKTFVEKNTINAVINCAAYTAVDKAETDEANANAVNHLAVRNLAQIAKEKNITLIHVSTDYVFDGKNFKPYTEDDTTNPNGVYGKTKLDGENALREINPPNALIIRTSWVYSSYGANFVKTMLRLGKEKESLGVIFDQVGTPTYARDLAKAILEIIQNSKFASFPTSSLGMQTDGNTASTSMHSQAGALERDGVAIYNYSNEGVLSWYDFAKEIMRMAKLNCQINPIETKEYPTPATRPHYSLLNKSKIKKEFGIIIPYWKDSLDACLRKMGERR